MKFKKEFMERLAYGDIDASEGEVIVDEIVETTRWSEIHEIVFKVDGKFYASSNSRGLTEQQDESPYEYDPDEIECGEVVPKEVIKIKYVKK